MFQLQNTPIPQGSIPVARESLAISDAMRGLQGMNPPNEGMYNADDGGAMSKPYLNAQPTENAFLAAQNESQNMLTAAPQAAAAAMGAVRKENTELSSAQNQAIALMNDYKLAQIQEDPGGSGALMALGAQFDGGPNEAAFRNRVGTVQAMAMGMDPALGAEAAQQMRYRRA